MTNQRLEQLEMAGYSYGRDPHTNSKPCYRHHSWSDEEADAFKKGFDEGVAYSRQIGELAR